MGTTTLIQLITIIVCLTAIAVAVTAYIIKHKRKEREMTAEAILLSKDEMYRLIHFMKKVNSEYHYQSNENIKDIFQETIQNYYRTFWSGFSNEAKKTANEMIRYGFIEKGYLNEEHNSKTHQSFLDNWEKYVKKAKEKEMNDIAEKEKQIRQTITDNQGKLGKIIYSLSLRHEEHKDKTSALISEAVIELTKLIRNNEQTLHHNEKDFTLSSPCGTAFRYKGQFCNRIHIHIEDDEPQITLSYDKSNEIYLDDQHEIKNDGYNDRNYKDLNTILDYQDGRNFMMLIDGLKTAFKNTEQEKDYERFNLKIDKEIRNNDFKFITDLERHQTELSDLLMFLITSEPFLDKSHYEEIMNKFKKQLVVEFPDNTVIRYKDRFHNCLIADWYGVSLGYAQQITPYAKEEEYHHDAYTHATAEEDRTSKVDMNILHRNLIITHKYNMDEQLSALNTINELWGRNIENLEIGTRIIEAR